MLVRHGDHAESILGRRKNCSFNLGGMGFWGSFSFHLLGNFLLGKNEAEEEGLSCEGYSISSRVREWAERAFLVRKTQVENLERVSWFWEEGAVDISRFLEEKRVFEEEHTLLGEEISRCGHCDLHVLHFYTVLFSFSADFLGIVCLGCGHHGHLIVWWIWLLINLLCSGPYFGFLWFPLYMTNASIHLWSLIFDNHVSVLCLSRLFRPIDYNMKCGLCLMDCSAILSMLCFYSCSLLFCLLFLIFATEDGGWAKPDANPLVPCGPCLDAALLVILPVIHCFKHSMRCFINSGFININKFYNF